jgi:hypothetical protein
MPRVRTLLLLAALAWASSAAWNALKPLPAGTRAASLAARLAESELTVVADGAERGAILARELDAVDRADQLIILDQTPLPRELGRRLLMKIRARPAIKIVLVSDPRGAAQGGTPAEYLDALEKAGVIVARARLDRLRDSNPLYSGLWRLAVGWWSDPFEEADGTAPLRASLRALNFKADRRQVLVADDGSGGWVSIMPASSAGCLALQIAGGLAYDIAASELQIAAWSSDDDRLPEAPRSQGPGLGSIDARLLTEGATRGAILDALAAAAAADEVSVSTHAISDRPLVGAALGAARRGAHIRVLLDPGPQANPVVAAELERAGGGGIEVRWSAPAPACASLVVVRHHGEVWAIVLSAELTRPDLGDFNLQDAVELRLPEHSVAARALSEQFDAQWSAAAPYGRYADESPAAYWRYRVLEAGGLAGF